MKPILLALCLAGALCGCTTTKLDKSGSPPPGWQLTPKPPVPF